MNASMQTVALYYLQRRDASSGRLVEYLTQLPKRYPRTLRYQGFNRAVAQQVVTQLQQMGAVDDVRYARNVLAGLRQRTIGEAKIIMHLRHRRVPEEIIRTVVAEGAAEDPRDLTRAIADARRKREQLTRAAGTDRRKLARVKTAVAAFLLRRGYQREEFNRIMRAAFP